MTYDPDREPVWTLSSYLFPISGCLIVSIIVKSAQHAHSGEWFSGLLEAMIGLFVVSLCTFLAAFAAFRRREKGAIAAIIPLLGGALGSLYFGSMLAIGFVPMLHHG